jgi:SagB-type dehydrogenase family enzyme
MITSGPVARITGPGGEIVLSETTSGILEALNQIAAGQRTYEMLADRVLASAGLAGLRSLHEAIGQLLARGWLAHRVCDRGVLILSAVPVRADYRLAVEPVGNRACVLSRFAFLRRDEERIVLESPTARAQIVLHDRRAMGLLWRLSKTRKTSGAVRGVDLPAGVVHSAIDLLWSAGFLTTLNGGDDVPEDDSPPLLHWEFHDLLFHSRSRLGRHRLPYGATNRLEGRIAPPPVVKPPLAGKRIRLVRPDIARLTRSDWPLTRAIERRRSQREHGDIPITRRELGEFLYRTARVMSLSKKRPFATSHRPYPSGGATYALELYLAVRDCRGMDAGLYHYCPARHELQLVARMGADVQALLAGAAQAARAELPQVLVIIAARFLRTSWKYSSISYALILKEVGVLMQTMYLVATAMELGACAIGGGDADLFAKAAGTNYYLEGSVGELIIGRVPQSAANSSSTRAGARAHA